MQLDYEIPIIQFRHTVNEFQELKFNGYALETGVQSQVESYQKLKKWYLIPP